MNTARRFDDDPRAAAAVEKAEARKSGTNGSRPAVESGGLTRPQPLPDRLPEVMAFRESMLPESLRGWVMDVSDRQQSPPDFAAIATIIQLGSLLGRKVAIAPKARDNWHEYSNLWGLGIGRPSSMKSPSFEAMMKPLDALAVKAGKANEAALSEYLQRCELGKLKRGEAKDAARKALRAGEKTVDAKALVASDGPEPTLRRYKTNSCNFASLHRLLIENPNGLLVYQDEIAGLFAALENGESGEELKAFLLQGWAGKQSFTADRIFRGQNLHVPRVCLSVLGTTQPGKISRWVQYANTEGVKDDGFLQRFNPVWPNVSGEWRNVDRWPDKASREACHDVFERLEGWSSVTAERLDDDDADSPALLRFDREAAEMFLEWRTGMERLARSGELSPAMESHLIKTRKTIPALSLIFALVEDDDCEAIGVNPLARALEWGKYLPTHAARLYAAGAGTDYDIARRILARIESGHLPADKPFPARNVYRNNWSGLSDREEVERGLRALVDHDWLIETRRPTSGAPAQEFHLNPMAKGAGRK